jgi:hypothetical protein
LWYYAPELVRQVPFLAVVDEWALGVICHVLLSGDFPFDAASDRDLEGLVLAGDLSHVTHAAPGSVWAQVSSAAKDVLLGLLQPAMKKRLTAAQALEHPWLAVDGGRSFIGSHIWAAGGGGSSSGSSSGSPGGGSGGNGRVRSSSVGGSSSGSGGAAAAPVETTAATLWHVHARLDRLSSTARLPRRAYPKHAFLVDTLDYKPPASSPPAAGVPAAAASTAAAARGAEAAAAGFTQRSLSSTSFASLSALQAAPAAPGTAAPPAPDATTTAAAAAPVAASTQLRPPQGPVVFVVEEGVCEVVRVVETPTPGTAYAFEHVGYRRKGSFVSADPNSYLPAQAGTALAHGSGGGGSGRFAVRAATAVTVSVLQAADMQ